MTATLKYIENLALQLSPHESRRLIQRASLEGEPQDSPETIAKAWDEEIARRVAEMEAGRTEWVSAARVISSIRARISAAKAAHEG